MLQPTNHPKSRLSLSGLILLIASTAPALASEEAQAELNGGEIFHDYCSVCHGDRGDARSRAQGSFFPPPRNFTTLKSAKELTRDRMIFSVTYGRPNTAMAGWGTRLTPPQVEAVVDFIRSNFMPMDQLESSVAASTEAAEGATDDTQPLEDSLIKDGQFDPEYMNQPMPYGLTANTDWGKLFYDTNCAVCHGVEGDGKGPRAYFILPKPRDYRHPAARHKLNRKRLFEVISEGSHGSEMPAWDKVLTHQEVAHVSEYIFQAFIMDEEQVISDHDNH